MNKQIKELAEQAGAYFSEAHTDYFGEEHSAFVSICDMDIEKFAELIIKECAAKAWWAEQYGIGDGTPISKQIEQHFEVE